MNQWNEGKKKKKKCQNVKRQNSIGDERKKEKKKSRTHDPYITYYKTWQSVNLNIYMGL